MISMEQEDLVSITISGLSEPSGNNMITTEVMLCDICGKQYNLSDMACYNICINCVDKVYNKDNSNHILGSILGEVEAIKSMEDQESIP